LQALFASIGGKTVCYIPSKDMVQYELSLYVVILSYIAMRVHIDLEVANV
jgi:hypothetical protein